MGFYRQLLGLGNKWSCELQSDDTKIILPRPVAEARGSRGVGWGGEASWRSGYQSRGIPQFEPIVLVTAVFLTDRFIFLTRPVRSKGDIFQGFYAVFFVCLFRGRSINVTILSVGMKGGTTEGSLHVVRIFADFRYTQKKTRMFCERNERWDQRAQLRRVVYF